MGRLRTMGRLRSMRWWPILALALAVTGCDSGLFNRRSAGPTGLLGSQNRQDPALSGNGRWLASVIEQGGKASVLLQEQPSGQMVGLRHLRGHEPQSSPSLSWNGRYVAAIVQEGPNRLAMIEDRASGNLIRLPLPGSVVPMRLSLAPDGRRVALDVIDDGRPRVQVFDLGGLLEPDQPGGLAVVGGGAGPEISGSGGSGR